MSGDLFLNRQEWWILSQVFTDHGAAIVFSFSCDPEYRWYIVTKGCLSFFCKMGKLPSVPVINIHFHDPESRDKCHHKVFLIIKLKIELSFRKVLQRTLPAQGFLVGQYTTIFSEDTCHPNKEHSYLIKIHFL